MLATALLCAGCATSIVQPPATPVPERLNFDGTLDLTGKGVGFSLTHPSGLTCQARHGSGRLPEAVTLPLGCTEQQTELAGTLVVKAADLRGAVTLADGRVGDVVFARPAAPPPPVVAAPVTPPPPLGAAPPPAPVQATVTVAPPPVVEVVPGPVVRTGPILVRSHYRRGGYVRGHYRAGRYVRPHYRRGTTVRAHSRKRR